VPGVVGATALFGSSSADEMFVLTAAGRLLHFGRWRASADVTDVTPLFPATVRDVMIEQGGTLSGCAVLVDGSAWCWGFNNHQALGDTAPSDPTPRRISGTWDGAIELEWGGTTVCGRFADGAVRCSGSCAGYGVRGDGCAVDPAIGTTVTGLGGTSTGDLDDAVALAGSAQGGPGQFCAVRRRGDVVCWGDALLGAGAITRQATPIRVLSD
jgi:hypothetical protein